jgi:hypothetical protein
VRDVLEAQLDPPPVLWNLDTGDRMNLPTGSRIKNGIYRFSKTIVRENNFSG